MNIYVYLLTSHVGNEVETQSPRMTVIGISSYLQFFALQLTLETFADKCTLHYTV